MPGASPSARCNERFPCTVRAYVLIYLTKASLLRYVNCYPAIRGKRCCVSCLTFSTVGRELVVAHRVSSPSSRCFYPWLKRFRFTRRWNVHSRNSIIIIIKLVTNVFPFFCLLPHPCATHAFSYFLTNM